MSEGTFRVVKPPTLRELIETYGDLKKTVKHLIEAGYRPEEIERKYGVPYYLIRLYLADFELKQPYPFYRIATMYDRLATLRSMRGKETELAKFFKLKGIGFEEKVRFALGQIFDENPKVGPGIIERAVSIATKTSEDKVRELFRDYGEHGEVASLLTPKREPVLTAEEVYNAIRFLPKLQGINERILYLASLLRVSAPDEAKYIVRLILQDLKLGYHEHTVAEAVARTLNVSSDLLREACSVHGVIGALLLAPKGDVELSKVKIRPGQFLPPQLAHLYDPDKVQFPVRVEYKYDGSRVQCHKWGTSVWLYSRRAVEKSSTLPEIVEVVKKFNAHSCIVDAEVIAVDRKGNFLPFQELLTRTVPRKYEEARAKEVNLTVRAFDVLYINGRSMMSLPLQERREFLKAIVPEPNQSEGRDCYSEVELMKFYQEALGKGLEGIIVKNLNSIYEAGRRTYTWLKLKPERDTLDCVVVKALYGKGARAGYYSSFELAVRDPAEKKLYTVGRVSNISEELMARFRAIIDRAKWREDREGVYVKPIIVLEVTYQEIQQTEDYTSGYALRVPKVVRIRDDKTVEDIDSVEKVKQLYGIQYEERFRVKEI